MHQLKIMLFFILYRRSSCEIIFTIHSSSHIHGSSHSNTIKNQHVYNHILSFISSAGETRKIELKIVSSSYGIVHTENGLKTTDNLPKQLTFQHTVHVSGDCTSVCSYRGNTYVGHVNGVDKIEGDNQCPEKFIAETGRVHSVVVYNERLYTLLCGSIRIYKLDGELVTRWRHPSIVDDTRYNKMTFVNDQLVIPDRQNKKLIVYSLTGEIQKRIDCPLLGENHVSICAIDDHSVVVSDCEFSKVFKVNISSGDVEWTSEHVPNPEGVAYYDGGVFVTNPSPTTRVWILNGKTGMLHIIYNIQTNPLLIISYNVDLFRFYLNHDSHYAVNHGSIRVTLCLNLF